MPIRKKFQKLCYYHVFNRGFLSNILFFSGKDYKKFQKLIQKNQKKFKSIEIIEYNLLPNHFHFIIQSKKTGYDISKFIRNICSAYGTYYFFEYGQQNGIPTYEGRFKSLLLPDLKYLETCIYYVQHNAKKHKLIEDEDTRERQSHPYNDKIILDIEKKEFKEKKIEY